MTKIDKTLYGVRFRQWSTLSGSKSINIRSKNIRVGFDNFDCSFTNSCIRVWINWWMWFHLDYYFAKDYRALRYQYRKARNAKPQRFADQ